MTSDDEWAAVRPTHRLSYRPFCEGHEALWRGVARARLHDEELVDRALHGIRRELRQNWGLVLSQPDVAAHAWMIAKRCITDRELGTGQTPPRAVVRGWNTALRHARVGIDPRNLDNYELLYSAILRLTERQHDMLVLHLVLEIDHLAIATHLGTTETDVRSTIRQGLAKLRRLIGADTTTEDMQ
ncbi:RNA polymerase sigma factor [Kitasatospora brasiliensis]|uniref:RNA polymerase sigma factor n=1 Tax=Kitasatospora brasiliensis TaxID=3058040 RepID=UPI00293042FE|nr:sigma factor-like helix-turn-helix DNA-binding protein [Kitasatospora sp. K002]